MEYRLHLADVRGRELLGAQVFLTTADLTSVSEIRKKTCELNDEIFQASALLAESLIPEVADWASEKQNASCNVARSILGDAMFEAMTSSNGAEINPFLVQLALQIYMTCFCREKLEKWYEKDKDINNFLVELYTGISGKGNAQFYFHIDTFF